MPGKKLLVIDDEASFVKVVAWKLERAGYEVIVAEEGITGFTMAQDSKPHLILLDFMLPKMDGMQVLAKLKQDPQTKDIPVIMMTALEAPEKRKQALALGAVDQITKPYDFPALLKAIQATIEGC